MVIAITKQQTYCDGIGFNTNQLFDNTITLPRYTDGVGVRAFVVATNPFVGGASFSVNYTDANGSTYNTDPIITPTTTNIGTIMNSTGAASQ
jgi:hypothetical protein